MKYSIALELKITRGRKLHTDGTVVETHIHYPTESSLLEDSVHVLSRLVKPGRALLLDKAELAADTFRERFLHSAGRCRCRQV
jgi:IS5 family transposase